MRIIAVLFLIFSAQTFALDCNEIAETISNNIVNKALLQNRINTYDEEIVKTYKDEALLSKERRDLNTGLTGSSKDPLVKQLTLTKIEIAITSLKTQRNQKIIERNRLYTLLNNLDRNNAVHDEVYQANCQK